MIPASQQTQWTRYQAHVMTQRGMSAGVVGEMLGVVEKSIQRYLKDDCPECPDGLDDSWRDESACRGKDPRFFETELYTLPEHRAEGKRICAGCPVRFKCLEYAEENHERHGLWGGMTFSERRKLKPRQTA